MVAHDQQSETDLFDPVVPPRRDNRAPAVWTPPPAPPPLPVAEPPVRSASNRSARNRSALGWLGLIVLAAVAVWRIATTGATAPATAQEIGLGTAVPAAGDIGEVVARVQLMFYTGVTAAFDRDDPVISAGRELAVLAGCATIGALLVVAYRRGIRKDAVALALAVLIVTLPAVAELARFGPGVLGVAWTAVGLAAALGTGRGGVVGGGVTGRAVGGVAVLVGILTAPLLAVPLTVAVVIATARRRAPVAAVTASLGSAVVVLQILNPTDAPGVPDGAGRVVPLLVGVGVVVAAAFAVRGLRAVALGAAGALVVAALPWAPAPTLLPALVVAAVALLGVLVSAAASRAADVRPWVVGVGRPILAVGIVAAVVVTGPAAFTTPSRSPAHLALAAWISSNADPDATFDAPPDVRADLVRDGIPAGRIVAGGTLVVAAPGADTGSELADFGDGLTVSSRTPTDPVGTAERFARAGAGRELAANLNLVAPAEVRQVLAAGSVDPRALVLLAGLTSSGPVHVDAVTAVAGESPSLPLHRIRVSGLDAATRAFLVAQQPPFAPLISPDDQNPDALTLTWPVPSTATLLGP